MLEVGIRELKAHLGEYVRRLRKGEQLTLTDRGKRLAVISPLVETDEQRIDRKLRELEARGVLTRGIGKPKGLDPPIRLHGEGPTMSEMIIEDRG